MEKNKIHILPPDIIGKIAAGEVIERPASVVKELVENALDAGAASIEVELKSAGKNLIRIRDTGTGIAKNDIEQLFSRHATSKIANIEDLYAIHSLGFRGEALYSIGAVSDVLLSSRTREQDCGWQAHVRGNEKISLKPCPGRTGTEIEIRELFFNTPARRKFLKSNAAELNAIIDTFLPYALLYADKEFSLSNDEKNFINLRAAKNLTGRIAEALELNPKDLIEGTGEFGKIRIRLILGDINIRRPRKNLQFIFINSRPVDNRSIAFHMNEIYRLLLAPGAYPFFCVYVDMPCEDLDVNVHPAKREVKINDDLKLISFLRPLCERLLMTNSKAKQGDALFKTTVSAPHMPADAPQAPPSPAIAVQTDEPRSPQPFIAAPPATYQTVLEQSIALFKTENTGGTGNDLKEKLRQARYLGNLLKKYLLFETNDSLLLIDQHAAQERITFEKLKKQLEKGKVEVQPLLTPVTFTLSPQELILWEENRETLEKTGFETTLFDKRTLAVHAHPALITDAEQSVRNLLAGGTAAKLDPEKIARMACRSSVMFGFAMNPEQAEFQRQNLLLCDSPFTCPHGRPTVVEIKEEHLRKQFLRA